MRIVAIVPVKNPLIAKMRLSKIFSQHLREKLTLVMLKDIIIAINSCKLINYTVIVTPNERINAIIECGKNVFLIKDEGKGQINAVMKGLSFAKNFLQADIAVILVADAPLIKPWDLYEIIRRGYKWNSVVLSPSDDGGTNVILQNPPKNMPLRYGKDSFRKHLSECRKRKLKCLVYSSESTSLDIDSPSDLEKLKQLGKGTYTYSFIGEFYERRVLY